MIEISAMYHDKKCCNPNRLNPLCEKYFTLDERRRGRRERGESRVDVGRYG
jgi:hypothetical protein